MLIINIKSNQYCENAKMRLKVEKKLAVNKL